MTTESPSQPAENFDSGAGEPMTVERGELVNGSPSSSAGASSAGATSAGASSAGAAAGDGLTETVSAPAKVMRIGSMVKQLLEEVRTTTLDDPSRERLAEIYERSIVELSEALSPDLQDELRNLALPFRDGEVPTDAELRIAKAQLVGWLEGLFHGIQATLFAQQLAARQQLEQMRQLPPGAQGGPGMQMQPGPADNERPGTYL